MKYGRRIYLPAIVVIFSIFIAFGNFFHSGAKTRITENIQNVHGDDGRDSLLKAFEEIRLDEKSGDGQTDQSRYGRQSKLTASDGAANDEFGKRVAISGNTAVIGSWHDDIGANADQGSAYVFERNSSNVWVLQQKLTASDGAANDGFGYSVAITNVNAPAQTVIMVGAFGNDAGGMANKGAVYVFVRSSGGTTWSQQGKLTASDGIANDVFGNSVSMSGSFAVIGANGVEVGSNLDQGAAYIFVRSGTAWVEEQKLTSSDGGVSDYFGYNVAISGTRAVIAAPYQDISGNINQGAAYIFERVTNGNSWNQKAKLNLRSPDAGADDRLGYSVAISGGTVIVGVYGNDNGFKTDQGAALVWTGSGTNWSAPQTLRAADGLAYDYFASSVAISGETAVIGSHRSDLPTSSDQGAVYVFKRIGGSFIQTQKLTASDGTTNDYFGLSVAVSDATILSGAAFDGIGSAQDQGSAYIFRITEKTPFDFDGDNKTDLSIFRPSSGEWFINRSSNGSVFNIQFGTSFDRLVPGDFTGDGKADIAFFRPSNGTWYVLRSENQSFFSVQFGATGDIPVPGNYDGDGKFDFAVFRPSDNGWYISKSTGGTLIVQFGLSSDAPIPSTFVR